MISASIRNPFAVAVACIFLVLAGVAAARALPFQLRPTVEPPEVQVNTSYAGAAPAEVEDQITRRIEDQLTSVNGLREMLSTSSTGRSAITLRFEDDVDRNVAMIDVLNKHPMWEGGAVDRTSDRPVTRYEQTAIDQGRVAHHRGIFSANL
jgi:multidrug efflux pump subunit AcrB